jgi:predicted P-loop ATPase
MTAQLQPFTAYFPLSKGKLPTPGWRKAQQRQDAKDNPWPQRHGINLHPGELIIDVDPRRDPKDKDGTVLINSYERLQSRFDLPETRVVRTPRGGCHIYYMIPKDMTVRKSQWDYPGIDFLTEGSQPCGAGTITEDGVYVLEQDLPIAQAPLEFLLSLERKPSRANYECTDLDFDDDQPEDISKFESLLYKAAPAVSGQGGNNQTFRLACYGRDFGLSKDRVVECLVEKFNPKCQPPWSMSELEDLVDHAYRYAKNQAGARSVAKDRELSAIVTALNKSSKLLKPVESPATSRGGEIADIRSSHLRHNWILDNKGEILRHNRVNARIHLQEEPRFRDMFYWDEFSNECKFDRAPWWDPDKRIPSAVTDNDVRQILDWFAGKAEYQVTPDIAWFAVEQLGFQRSRHPVKAYLESLTWDRVPRLDELLITTCGAADTPYTRLISKNVLIAAIARIYRPGELVKNVLIFEGAQDRRKSMWIDTLGAPWSSVGQIVPGDKDTYINLAGNWIVELPEINQTLGKRDINAVKGIVSTREDTYRAPYERKSQKVPRQSIFIGSINPTAIGYLVDETGDSRYWPVAIVDCNVEKLKQMKDQIWAEAYARFKQGESWWFSDSERHLAEIEQAKRKKFDPWVPTLAHCLNGTQEIETLAVFRLLGLSAAVLKPSDYDRVAATMRALGFTLTGFKWQKS